MWSKYQLERVVTVLTPRVEEAWKELRFAERMFEFTYKQSVWSLPIIEDHPLKNTYSYDRYRKAQREWSTLRRRLESAKKQLAL